MASAEAVPTGAAAPTLTRKTIEDFLYLEARLADEHRYVEWEALWTDDALYWVPAAAADDAAVDRQVSIIYDNRHRIATRVRQLTSGDRYAQRPPSSLRRIISNIEVLAADDSSAEVAANVLVVEVRLGQTNIWASRNTYLLRVVNDDTRLVRKEVRLVGADGELPTLAFLI